MTVQKHWNVEIKGEFEIEHHAQDFVNYLENVLAGQEVEFEIKEVQNQ